MPILKGRGSHHRGKSACPFLGQRDTVEHWRLVNDVVEARTGVIILKRKSGWYHRDIFDSIVLVHKLYIH